MDIDTQTQERRNPKNRVKVAVRARPMISRQLVSHDRPCIDIPNKQEIIIGNDRCFKFDRVFKQSSNQTEVYEQCIKDLVIGCFEGYNAAVLAYGQTGSGKTYTMGTNTTMECSEEGIVPKVINDIFHQIDRRKNQAQFTIKASFLEIYNEQIIDLLQTQKSSLKMKQNNVSIREQKDGSISIQGVVEQYVSESAGMLALLDRGSINRTTAATLMNDSSSRSHAIFTVFIEQHPLQQSEDGFITAKFFFVDLAGSERIKKTGTTGATMKQGININLGLLELGNVISALSTDKKDSQFISYRNSKLTRILQDSLGGNSNTYMIACISPAESNYEESLNTLKYASKAMNIKNKPVINRDPHSAMLNQLRQRIKQLQDENARLKDLLKGEGINFDFCLNQSKSNNDGQVKRLELDIQVLKKTNEKLFLQLKDFKKRKSQLEIQNYEIQRQRDILNSIVDQFKANHPEFQIQVDELYNKQNIPLIENYLNKIQHLQTEIHQKDKINNQLQIEYTKLHEISERNQQILVKKNEVLYKIAKQNKDLRKLAQDLKQEMYKINGVEEQEQDLELQQMSIINDILEDQQNLQHDEYFHRQISAFSRREQCTKSELKSVEKFINQKENMLSEIAQDQMELQKMLILQMKEKYHQKITELEHEKNLLIKQQRNQISSHTTQKLANKIDSLQIELRQYRGKAKQQKQMETKVNNQNNVIKNLGNEIKNFKMQKIQLSRKLKEDKECFQKFKQKRTQQLLAVKKDNMRKDVQIRKLTNENKKKAMVGLKRAEQIKKIKKVNETLKKLFRPIRKNISRFSSRSERDTSRREEKEVTLSNKQIQGLITECLRNMFLKIDRDFDLFKFQKKCTEINKQLDILVKQEANLTLKIQQLNIQDDQFDFDNIDQEIERETKNSEMKADLHSIKDTISMLQQNLQFFQKKYGQILEDRQTKFQYCFETAILYNPKYDDLNTFREILRGFVIAFHQFLVENYQLKIQLEEMNIKNNSLLTEIEQLKENIIKMNLEHQQRMSELREQLILKLYEESYEQNNKEADGSRMGNMSMQTGNKMTDKQRKMYEKKIDEMTKKNNKLLADNETWRRKCEVVTGKYHNIRSVFNKDRFVGRANRQQQNNINHPNFTNIKEQRKLPGPTPNSYQAKIHPNSNIMEELNAMTEHLQSARAKKHVTFQEDVYGQQSNCDTPIFQTRRDFNRYKWQCVGTIQAHNSPVLCVKSHQNMMVSSANRNIRIWDLSDNKLVSDITNNNLNYLNYYVRSLAIHPEKQLMAAACDKLVTLWDLRQSSNQGVIRGHKQQVRCLHIVDNYLFTAGKGLSNSDSLLVWDLRYIKFNSPTESKQRNQDIFSMTSHNKILYYGSRDHHVRRLNIDTLETLTTFQPPHMDTVTGLAIYKGSLISGSKDKNLRLWSLDNSIYNLKSTVHASNDYINCVQGDPLSYTADSYHPLFYAGDRTGQVKVGTIIKQKIEFVGGFAHSQPVNTICSLQTNNRCTATGSTDKSIKLWQPTTETFHQIQSNLC